MTNYLKFLVKLILPFIIPFLFISIIQGMIFDINLWQDGCKGAYISMVLIFLVLTLVFEFSENL